MDLDMAIGMFQYSDLIWHEPDPDYLQTKVLVRSA